MMIGPWPDGANMRSRIHARLVSLPCAISAFTILLLSLQVTAYGQADTTAPPSSSQIRIPPEATLDEAALNKAVVDGENLERQSLWADAIIHYEESLRSFPNRREIDDRITRAKIHFDIERRYGDSSFLSSIKTINEAKALELYREVLLKIQTHHVDNPNWSSLVQRGMSNLYYAMEDRAFLSRHLPQTPTTRIHDFRNRVYRTVKFRDIGSIHQASEQVQFIANLAERELKVSTTATILEFTCGAMASLDPYSSFLSSRQLDDVFSQIEGNFVGLGIELKAESKALLIVNVISDSPASKGNIVPGDRIIGVDGKTVGDISTDEAADMLKGLEGSTVIVTIQKTDEQIHNLTLERQRVDVPSVEDAKILDKERGIAYFRMTSFQKTTNRDVDNALWSLYREGMKVLIIDLRGNPGGLLTASVEMADKFVTEGSIVSTRGRSAREDFDYKAHTVGPWRVPLIVLIDSDTASASEIFAAAVRDHKRGRIVGQRSYGKGSVQGIFPLTSSKAGVRLTTAKFYSPNGQAISKQGVTPDVVVHNVAKLTYAEIKMLDEQKDASLRAGLQIARQHISRAQPE
jgi:carboxyl-terminal processing protease